MTIDHIGAEIKTVVERKNLSVSEFARKINTSRENAYSIFKRRSVDIKLLQLIGNVLTHDFFAYYTPLGEENETLRSQVKFLEGVNFQQQKMSRTLSLEQKVTVSNAADVYAVMQKILLSKAPCPA